MDAGEREALLAEMRAEMSSLMTAALAPLLSKATNAPPPVDPSAPRRAAADEPVPGPSSRPDHEYAPTSYRPDHGYVSPAVASYEEVEESDGYDYPPEDPELGVEALQNVAACVDDDVDLTPPAALLASLTEEVDDSVGPPLDPTVAEACGTLLRTGLPPAKVKELSAKYPTPENCDNMGSVTVNSSIWDMLRPGTRVNDQKWQKMQHLLSKAMIALAKAMEEVKAAAVDKPSLNPTFGIMAESFALLATNNREIKLKRRDLMRDDFSYPFKALCRHSTPITKQLFGDNVEEEIKSK
jgi:hypothetical protein